MTYCSFCGSIADDVHHVIPRSEGGTDDPDNLIPVCKACHTRIHSERGDWSEWGRRGGRRQREHMTFLWTLKQYRDDALARLTWVLINRPDALEAYLAQESQYLTPEELTNLKENLSCTVN